MWKRILESICYTIKKQTKLSLTKKIWYTTSYFHMKISNAGLVILRLFPNEASLVDYGGELLAWPSDARLRLSLTSFQGQLVSYIQPDLGNKKTQSRIGITVSLNFAPEYWDFHPDIVYYAYLSGILWYFQENWEIRAADRISSISSSY